MQCDANQIKSQNTENKMKLQAIKLLTYSQVLAAIANAVVFIWLH